MGVVRLASRRWLSLAVVLGALAGGAALADTYRLPTDFRVARLDAATGKSLWAVSPGPLVQPRLSLVGGAVRVVSEDGVFWLDAGTGASLDPVPKGGGPAVEPLPRLPRNLTTDSGWTLEGDDGNTRHLIGHRKGQKRLLRELPDFPYHLVVVGDRVFYTFAGGVSRHDTGGGEVHAYDVTAGRVAWTFRAAEHLGELSPHTWTGIDLDGQRLLVSVDQSIFALDLAGKVLWHTRLPRQALRRYDAAWTTIGRWQDRLVVRCYEDLFVLDGSSGELVWRYDAGPFGHPWPVVAGDAFFVATRAHASATR